MMTSPNENVFRVTGPLCGEFTGHRWISLTMASDAELCCFLWKGWVNNRDAGDVRRHRAHYDVIVMHKDYNVRIWWINCVYFCFQFFCYRGQRLADVYSFWSVLVLLVWLSVFRVVWPPCLSLGCYVHGETLYACILFFHDDTVAWECFPHRGPSRISGDLKRNDVRGRQCNMKCITVPADVLAPNGSMASAVVALTFMMTPVTRKFDVFFDLRLNKRLSKQ